MAPIEDIRTWLQEGLQNNATHVVIVCDTFKYDYYPVYVEVGRDVRAIAKSYNSKHMQKIVEVYNLSLDIEKQLGQHRCFEY